MRKSIITGLAIVLCGAFALAENACCANQVKPGKTSCSLKKQQKNKPVIEKILSEMNAATQKLTSCQANVSYLVVQDPEIYIDSKTLQNGVLYYQKADSGSKLRIRFDDLKQDDFDPIKQTEEYLFDGVWLTRIIYKLEQH